LKIYEMAAGQRMMTSYIRVGGVAVEPPLGFFDRIKKFMSYFPGRVDEYEELLTMNRIWMARTKGVGYISAEDAMDLGLTGPSLRASGVNWDLRKDNPYLIYDKFDFNVPVRTEGDVYARYLLRLVEIRESIKIVNQALEGMPEGPVRATVPGIVMPEREKMKTEMEALIYHFKIVTEGFRVPAGEVYQAIESPRGEMGYYMVSDGTSKPYRVAVRSPSYGNLQALPKLAEGFLVADMIACIGSIDIVLGEIDR
jgi:NADH-quinone oxidoreductase subunit D